MEKQPVGEYALIEFLLTYLWAGMECFAAILLFDGFSERKHRPSIHWLIAGGLYHFGGYRIKPA